MLRFAIAGPDDAPAIAALRTAAARDLTARHGTGHWSGKTSADGARLSLRSSRVCVAWSGDQLVACLSLATRKPWAIDPSYFSAAARPLYLGNMAVAPEMQRQGIGRLCIAEAARLARAWPADALRLDAYDAPAGAGEFYARTGFREVGRVSYRGTPLIYYEMLL